MVQEDVKAEPKEEVEAAAIVIAKNQMLDIFSFVDHRHIITLKIKRLNTRNSMLVDAEDPGLN